MLSIDGKSDRELTSSALWTVMQRFYGHRSCSPSRSQIVPEFYKEKVLAKVLCYATTVNHRNSAIKVNLCELLAAMNLTQAFPILVAN